jgi:hypothetical protein
LDIRAEEGDDASGKIGHGLRWTLGWTRFYSIVACEETDPERQAGFGKAPLVLEAAAA